LRRPLFFRAKTYESEFPKIVLLLHQLHFSPLSSPDSFFIGSAAADVHFVDGEVVGVLDLPDRTTEQTEQDSISEVLVLRRVLAVEPNSLLRVIAEHPFKILVLEPAQIFVNLCSRLGARHDELYCLNVVVQS